MEIMIKLYHQYDIITLHTSTVKTSVIGILFEVSIAYFQPLLGFPWQFDIGDPLYPTLISYSCIYYQLHNLTDLDRDPASRRHQTSFMHCFPFSNTILELCLTHSFFLSFCLCWSRSSLCLIKHGVGKPVNPVSWTQASLRTAPPKPPMCTDRQLPNTTDRVRVSALFSSRHLTTSSHFMSPSPVSTHPYNIILNLNNQQSCQASWLWRCWHGKISGGPATCFGFLFPSEIHRQAWILYWTHDDMMFCMVRTAYTAE